MNKKTCHCCKGDGRISVEPYSCSPPNAKFSGGYESHSSNIKTKMIVSCDMCDGKGHIDKEDHNRYLRSMGLDVR